MSVNEETATYAAIGTSGERVVVWGLGDSHEAALADAAEQDTGGSDVKLPELKIVEIEAAAAELVHAGEVALWGGRLRLVGNRIVVES